MSSLKEFKIYYYELGQGSKFESIALKTTKTNNNAAS